jgi:hypothetical protein
VVLHIKTFKENTETAYVERLRQGGNLLLMLLGDLCTDSLD